MKREKGLGLGFEARRGKEREGSRGEKRRRKLGDIQDISAFAIWWFFLKGF